MFKYVLTDPRYTFWDRMQYFGTIFLGFAGVILTLRTLIIEKRASFVGLALMGFVLSQALKINNKFVLPFTEEYGFTNEAQIQSDLEAVRYINEVQPKLDRAFNHLISKIRITIIVLFILMWRMEVVIARWW
jgi:mannose/fructose/N-acetylgalactosamine-specific phosphotransferase system component IID